ncbi:flavin reductase family protein [Stakelama saccharophila]|uniref:Flavin reductase family protein n=1 Tax=Stakelama saccharophila TaxID=3075605 RepID=A0ABZ0BAT5_9SPHN|nr:flavin reductase family protein [Stakelama sp. W311]WNO54175.1 flavin reductase family protein [Stakelama sp. W311]
MPDFHFYEPATGHGLAHNPLNAIVAPRPIGWVSTLSAQGKRNLAPYSFFNLINYTPPLIAFSSIGWKDSVANIGATGEFVWNLATRAQAEQVNATATAQREVDEFETAKLDTLPATIVKPQRVAGSPVQFECKLTQLIQLTDKDGGAIDSWLVIGEAVGIHIDTAMIEDGVYQTAKARPILRGGGPSDYFEPGELFHMIRPD